MVLRAYLRQRDTLVAGAADPIRRMQNALRQMNLLLDNVVSDITGHTGQTIIRAILDGERDPAALASLRDLRCRHDAATIAASLEGHWRDEHLFVLRQCHETYTFHHQQIQACERAICCIA